MRCHRAQQMLMAYHDSELSPGAARRLEKHLDSCEECSRLLERLRLADQHASDAVGDKDLIGVSGVPSSDDRYWESFTAQVLDRVEEDAATRVPERRRPRRSWELLIPRMAPAFSIALVVVIAAGVLLKIGDPTPVVKAPVPTAELPPAMETPPTAEIPTDKSEKITEGEEPGSGIDLDEKKSRAGIPEEKAAVSKAGRTVTAKDTDRMSPAVETGPSRATPTPKTVSAPKPEIQKGDDSRKQEQIRTGPEKRSAQARPATQPEKSEATEVVPENLKSQVAPTPSVEKEREAAIPEQVPATAPRGQEDVVVQPEATAVSPTSSPVVKITPPVTSTGNTDIDSVPPDSVLTEEPDLADGAKTSSEDDRVVVAGTISTEGEPEDLTSPAADLTAMAASEPELLQNEKSLFAAGEPSEENRASVPGIEALESSVTSESTRQPLDFRQSPYRGPEDQLTHARNLADVRKFWESEQVLKDLLDQEAPSTVQEEAVLLLVEVLSSQNRIGEARQVLDDARAQFPASEMIQSYELKVE